MTALIDTDAGGRCLTCGHTEPSADPIYPRACTHRHAGSGRRCTCRNHVLCAPAVSEQSTGGETTATAGGMNQEGSTARTESTRDASVEQEGSTHEQSCPAHPEYRHKCLCVHIRYHPSDPNSIDPASLPLCTVCGRVYGTTPRCPGCLND